MFEETVRISSDYLTKQYRQIAVALELQQAVQAVKLFVIQLSLASYYSLSEV
jgi:hypothetical protein